MYIVLIQMQNETKETKRQGYALAAHIKVCSAKLSQALEMASEEVQKVRGRALEINKSIKGVIFNCTDNKRKSSAI